MPVPQHDVDIYCERSAAAAKCLWNRETLSGTNRQGGRKRMSGLPSQGHSSPCPSKARGNRGSEVLDRRSKGYLTITTDLHKMASH